MQAAPPSNLSRGHFSTLELGNASSIGVSYSQPRRRETPGKDPH
uniref:Uncharacterized protein n=1 Tax=Rhizophora mucronata TaxID=61149 RepID=A0A2P2QHN2_RHIMU